MTDSENDEALIIPARALTMGATTRAATLLLLIALTGCWELVPGSQDPLQDAAHQEPRVCPLGGPAYPAELFNPRMVVSFAPLYYTHSEHGNEDSRLFGATLVLRPIPGLGAEELERLLSCHGARALLHRSGEPEVLNDPYAVAGHVVRVHVSIEDGALTVDLEARDFEGAKEVLQRAQAFAAAR